MTLYRHIVSSLGWVLWSTLLMIGLTLASTVYAQTAPGDGTPGGGGIIVPTACTRNSDCNQAACEVCSGGLCRLEPTLGTTCEAGVGECRRSGTLACRSGEIACNAVPGTPSTESCDGLDNDCDGTVDNDVPGSGDICFAGTGACRGQGTVECVGGSIACTAEPLADGTSCSDGNACNGEESCQGGRCQAGSTPNIDDGDACTIDTCDAVTGIRHEFIEVDDDIACTVDACNPATGEVTHNPDHSACNDRNACNGAEICTSNGCQAGTPIDSDDKDVCTADACDPATGRVTHTPIEGCCLTNAECNDNDVCTTEQCSNNTCVAGDPVSVDDGDLCTTDSCDPVTGVHHEPVDVDDGIACTVDRCTSTGQIRQIAHTPDDSACDDGDACNGAEICTSSGCQAGTPVSTDDGDACTTDACDPATGAVSHVLARTDIGQACDNGETGVCLAQGVLECDEATGVVSCSAPAGTPAAETCDGLDNDCDGSVDEDIASRSCTTAQPGVCAEGTQSCAGGTWGACESNVSASTETCDSIDNDCDGFVDEDLSQACYDGPPGTEGVTLCRGGTQICTAGSWGTCLGQVVPSTEICDGRDNDCNGTTDDAPGTGAACTVGEGACRSDGTTVCQPDGSLTCNATAGTPGTELCGDGIDNDCDGSIDEGFADLGRTCTIGIGPCAGTGEYICSANGLTVECNAQAAADGAPCPDDNACNGNELCQSGTCQSGSPIDVDDGDACTTDACDPATGGVTHPRIAGCCLTNADCSDNLFCTGEERCIDNRCAPAAELPDPRLGQNCRLGDELCSSPGVWACNEDADRVECNSVLRPDGFSCSDGDTCNGNETCQSGTCQAGTPLPLDDGNACTTDACDPATGVSHTPSADIGQACDNGETGACLAQGVLECDEATGVVSCSAPAGTPAAETCDGLDNDCDGIADNGLIPPSRECSAGVGECSGAGLESQVCEGVGGWSADYRNCDAAPVADGTSCADGLFCNGEESCSAGSCVAGAAPSWDDGNACTTDSCDEEADQIIHTAVTVDDDIACTADSCDPATGQVSNTPDDTACDDNNPCTADACTADGCFASNLADGTVLADGRICNSGTPGECRDGASQSCSTGQPGVCAEGTQTCSLGTWGSCEVTQVAITETCDGLDNDCDGQTDEDLSQACYDGPDGTAGVGICQEGTQTCTAGAWGTCTGQIQPATEICDNLDNDCDGFLNEGFNVGQSCEIEANGCTQTGSLACDDAGNETICQPSTSITQNECGVCGQPDPANLGQPCESDGETGCRGTGAHVCNAENPSGPAVCNAQPLAGQTCSDNNACTSGETCQSDGNCGGGTAAAEPEATACQIAGSGVCDPATGNWTFNERESPELGEHEIWDTATCTVANLPYCGDGNVDADEQCDGTAGIAEHQECDTNCRRWALPYCGDGELNQDSERCDGTAGVGEHQICDTATCALVNLPYCGDGTVQENETCDLGTANSDENPGACRTDCTGLVAYCGDGNIDRDRGEACDDGELNDQPGRCNTTCTGLVAYCGDGNVDSGETCDDGELNGNANHCDLTCTGTTPPACGNEVVEEGEQCESNSTLASNEECVDCRIVSREPVCGDGLVEGEEACEEGVTELAANQQCAACEIVARPEPPVIPPVIPPVVPPLPEPVALCGDGFLDEGEVCDEGEANNDDTEGACRTDCSGPVIHVGRGMDVPAPPACSSTVIDCAKTCTKRMTPAQEVFALAVTHPEEFDRQVLLIAGGTEETGYLLSKKASAMDAQCDFSFDIWSLETAPWKTMVVGAVNGEEANDLFALSEDNRYYLQLDIDQWLEDQAEARHLAPRSLQPDVPDFRSDERRWIDSAGRDILGRVVNIHAIAAYPSALLGVVELLVDEPEQERLIAAEIFTLNEEDFEQSLVPVISITGEEAESVAIRSAAWEAGTLSSLSLQITTMDGGARWLGCNRTTGDFVCVAAVETMRHLAVVDTEKIRQRVEEQSERQRALRVIEEEREEEEIEAEEDESERPGRGHQVLITTGGEWIELEEVEEEITEIVEEEREEEDIDDDDDEARDRGRGRGGVERVRTRRYHRAGVRGEIEAGAIRPESRRAITVWLEPDPNYENIVVAEEAALQGLRFEPTEAGPAVIRLENESYTADSVLNDILSDDIVRFIRPFVLTPILRNNYGGPEFAACFEAVEASSGDRLGTVCSIFSNFNEDPAIAARPQTVEGNRITLEVRAADPTLDNTVCRATLTGPDGADLSSRIVGCDLEETGTLEIDLEGLVEEGAEISVDVSNGETSYLWESPSDVIASVSEAISRVILIPSAHAQQTGQVLRGSVCATDPGEAQDCTGFTITVGQGLAGGEIEIPIVDRRGGTTGGTETDEKVQWVVRGGCLLGGNNITQRQAPFASSGGVVYLFLAISLLVLMSLRRKLNF